MVKKKQREEPSSFDLDAGRAQWLKGVLEICLLSVIGDGEAYGYEIANQLEQAGLGTIKGGTLYPRLTALETSGLLQVEWRQGESGPGRKYYRLTPAGQLMLAEASIAYDSFSEVISGVLAGTDRRKSDPKQRDKSTSDPTSVGIR